MLEAKLVRMNESPKMFIGKNHQTVELKTQNGRIFNSTDLMMLRTNHQSPLSDNRTSLVDCLLSQLSLSRISGTHMKTIAPLNKGVLFAEVSVGRDKPGTFTQANTSQTHTHGDDSSTCVTTFI